MIYQVLSSIFLPSHLLLMNLGVAAGIIIGALPGLSVVVAITLLLPLTFGMSSIAGMYLLLGAYCGGVYGGSITAILINTPGTPGSSATLFDGYPMAQKGRAGDALRLALISSGVGGIASCFALMFIAPPLAKMALKFGPPEYFALCMFGLSIVSGISGGSVFKGLLMACIGLFISTVGVDATEGIARFTFGKIELLGGLNPAVVMLGIFALSEMLTKSKIESSEVPKAVTFSKATIKLKEIFSHWRTLLRSSLIGIFIGAVPGTGGAIAAFLAYNEERRTSKHPEKFGTGCVEGVIAPECGNNAVTGATLIPLLTLGIPGDTAVAVMLGALTMQGIVPGPNLFAKGEFWVYAIMGGLLLINIFMILQGTAFVGLFTNVTKIPFSILLPSVMMLCTLGAYSVTNAKMDIFIMLAFGLLGFILKKYDFPFPPLTIALVLGSLTENNLRRSLIMSDGSVSIFFTRPSALFFIIISVLSILYPVLQKLYKQFKTPPIRN